MLLTMPFQTGDLVVVILREPRERLWGRLLGLEAPGIALRGLDLTPWEEVLGLVRTGEADQVALSTRFLPMHRVEAMYLDEASSGAPSLADTFLQRTGQDPQAFLADAHPR
ncbi:MAG: hypothetical protein HY014_00260 [Acidobacteria bacterium]|nr:hypothetical protein [Acidobacteriota bacterium]MBI3486584.1 hypothetical protein [Acidobacteriota bacterium]